MAYKKLKCCSAMVHAQEDGTDNEGYGPLVYQSMNKAYYAGSDSPPINRCPWCGTKVKRDKDT